MRKIVVEESPMEAFVPVLFLSFVAGCRPAFSKPTWPYFQAFLWAFLLVQGRKCVTRLTRACFFLDRSLSSFERFMETYQWDLLGAVQGVAGQLVQRLGPALQIEGGFLMGLDGLLVAKEGKEMPGVQGWHDSSENADRGERIRGHHWMLGALLSRFGERFLAWPLVARLVSGQQNPCTWIGTPEGELRPATIWDVGFAVVFSLAAVLGGLPGEGGPALRVVADAFFSKAPFINGLRERGIPLISRLRHDAVGRDTEPPPYGGRGPHPKKGRKWKLRDLLKVGPVEELSVHLYRRRVTVRCVVRDVWLHEVTQKVRVVVIQARTRPVLLMSTDLTLSARAIIEIYGARFAMEEIIRDLKQHLGLEDYQAWTYQAILRFVHLCCWSCCVWRWMLLPEQATTWLPSEVAADQDVTPLSFLRAQRGLRRFVLERLLNRDSASEAESEKSEPDWEAVFRIAA
jgi:hypothetical protein